VAEEEEAVDEADEEEVPRQHLRTLLQNITVQQHKKPYLLK
jgi:hypothetical protein